MKPEQIHLTHEVFGITRELPLNYVIRKEVDGKFIDSLTRKKHVIVHGGSKQGKTSLRKYNLDDEDYVTITCQTNWSIATLMGSILKAVGYRVGVIISRVNERTLSGNLKVRAEFSPPLTGLKISGEASSGSSNTNKPQDPKFSVEIDLADVNDIIDCLQRIDFNKKIVLEDFHYLPIDTQRQFAFALKSFHENSDYTFIIVGVWKESSRLTRYNGDLNLRVISVDADMWSADEIVEVIAAGEILLNVQFSDKFKDDLLKSSFDSVYLVQEACYRACLKAKIERTGENLIQIGEKISAKDMIKEVVLEQTGRYQTFLTNFARGFQETKLDMYKWICYAVLKASTKEASDGLTLKKIMTTVKSKHPEGDKISAASFTNALSNVAYLQAQKDIRPIILDYDENNRRLDVVDKGFIIWKAIMDLEEQMEILDLPSD